MDLKDLLKQEIAKAIEKSQLEVEVPDIKIEIPKDKENGDFSTNIAMVLTKLARKNPRDIADDIITNLDNDAAQIESVSVAGPGFINFKMKTEGLTSIIKKVLEQGKDYGRTKRENPQKILVEFVSANPTGDLTMAHGRHAALGDSIANILDFSGHEVTKEYYINDAGKQIENLALSIEARMHQALGNDKALPEDGYQGQDVIALGEKLAKEQPELLELDDEARIQKLRDIGVQYEMDKLNNDLVEFGVKFDNWFSETSLYQNDKVEETVKVLTDNGHTYEQDGALWLKTTTFGDDKDRVLKKSDGSYTYLTPDIAYHADKLARGYDTLIDLLGADHHGYIGRLKASIAALGDDSDKLEVLIMQIVRLIKGGEEVKMSKRTGKSVTLRDLINDVGVDASRYFLAMRSNDTHFDFDMDLAQSESSDNPVFYAQYAHARICSILRQADSLGFQVDKNADFSPIENEAALNVLKTVGEFPNVIISAAEKRAPQRVTNYIQELSSSFHKFYNRDRVITDDKDKVMAYVAMLEAVRQTLENALSIVGVSAPERM